ncbi:MAG: UDP-3-O-[3-hydroxymyristoyl] N-acetylglucosamine deacetylase, partial [Acidobacteria bacterium]|nr:UDP-3-O-[3-hydroxymyristoyl] N-acetylglucosamine deacetylase [Acidobacteriota bacterium]
LDNAVVLDPSGVLNGGLRYPDEFVRHKLMDLLGDISLCGLPIIGRLEAERAGHAIHTALASLIIRSRECYRILNADEVRPTLADAG